MASTTSAVQTTSTTRFLASHNPALVKRNFLASFTSVLLLPVTIVPRVGGVLMTGGSAGIAMLNPQRWGGGGGVGLGIGMGSAGGAAGYSKNLEKDGGMLFEVDEKDIEEEDEEGNEKASENDTEREVDDTTLEVPEPASAASTGAVTPTTQSSTTDKLDLLLSLDIALELIHADRESLKRVETFSGYPGHYGHRVRDTIEEIFILFLQAASDRHMSKGFQQCVLLLSFFSSRNVKCAMGV